MSFNDLGSDAFEISGISGNLYFNWSGPSGFGQVEIRTREDGTHYINGECLTKKKLKLLLASLIDAAETDRGTQSFPEVEELRGHNVTE
jgi:hypothetical protein